MLLFEYHVRDQFQRVREYAQRLHLKFQGDCPLGDLLLDVENLKELCDRLLQMLPDDVARRSNLGRHLWFMKENLSKGKRQDNDIFDICNGDLPILERAFKDWLGKLDHFDLELAKQVSDLLSMRQYDSAVRKAFVVLKERLVQQFAAPPDLDGSALVNKVFGGNGLAAPWVEPDECQAMRNLLDGMYGVFRNHYSHHSVIPPYHETEAIISMINYVLKRLDEYRSRTSRR